MRSYFHSWHKTLTKLGYTWTKRNKKRRQNPFGRSLRIEPLEERQMLTTITVDSFLDDFDPSNPTTDGVVTLREAVQAANLNAAVGDAPAGSGADTIVFSGTQSDDKTITLDRAFLGEISITDTEDLTIDASALNSLTIDADDPTPGQTGDGVRVFNILDRTAGSAPSLVTLVGLTLTGADADGDGGAIFSTTRLIVRDSTIQGNEADKGGGIFVEVAGGGVMEREVLRIENSIIDSNSAFTGAGVAVESGGFSTATLDTILITGTTIMDNKALFGNGGGVYAELFGAAITIDGNSVLKLNEAGRGGGIYADLDDGATLTINGATIDQNDASSQGAGFYAKADAGSLVRVVTTTLFDNESSSDGGGGYVDLRNSSTLSARLLTFDQNDASRGGGLFVDANSGSIVNITNITFDSNEATSQGGGVYVDANGQSIVDIAESIFFENDASSNGGGLVAQLFNGSELELLQLTFDTNTSSNGGGLHVTANDASLVVNSSNLINNQATASGGGAHLSTSNNATVEIQQSVVTGNQANTGGPGFGYAGGGGGVFGSIGEYSALTIADSLITQNIADEGGGVRLNMPYGAGHNQANGAVFTMQRSRVEANRATNRGGGIYTATGSGGQVTIEESVITGNDAGIALAGTGASFELPNSGGGIYAYLFSDQDSAILTIAGSEISGNTAGEHGGGIAVCTKRQNDTSAISRLSVYNTTISGNQAGHTTAANNPGTGGGVHLAVYPFENEEALDAQFQNATITGNTADVGGGIYSFVPTANYPGAQNNVWLTNTIISGNNQHDDDTSNFYGSINPEESKYNLISDDGVSMTGTPEEQDNYFVDYDSNPRTEIPFSALGTGNLNNSGTNDPKLSTLQYHGGLTRTHAPLTDSPAIDAGSNMLAEIPFTTTTLTTDQRGTGFPRLFDVNGVGGEAPSDIVDIGAYEIGLTKVVNVILSNSSQQLPTSVQHSFATATVVDLLTGEIESAVGAGNQLRTVPVGGVVTVEIVFSEPVDDTGTTLQNSLTVAGLTTFDANGMTQATVLSFDYNAATRTAMWTFDSPLDVADFYRISLDDTVTDLDDHALDGEWSNPTSIFTENAAVSEFPSGDGTAGGDFHFIVTILPGDASLDGIVDISDFFIFAEHFGQTGIGLLFTDADFNGDGAIDIADYFIFIQNFGVNLINISILGDLNGDLTVEQSEVDSILTNNIDLNGDGVVNQDDVDLAMEQLELGIAWVS